MRLHVVHRVAVLSVIVGLLASNVQAETLAIQQAIPSARPSLTASALLEVNRIVELRQASGQSAPAAKPPSWAKRHPVP
jgi:hypothetical protein